MRFEDETRITYSGSAAGASWYKNINRVFVTLSVPRTGAKNRKAAEEIARRVTQAHDIPDWKCTDVKRLKGTPDLCLVIGEVK